MDLIFHSALEIPLSPAGPVFQSTVSLAMEDRQIPWF